MKRWKAYASLSLVMGIGMSLSAIAAGFVGEWERSAHQLEFQRQTENLAIALQRTLNRYTDVLLSIGDFYEVSQNEVSQAEFSLFVRRSISTYPGIQALEWSPLILHRDRSFYEESMQQIWSDSFAIVETENNTLILAKERSEYFPVTYIEPLRENEAALGFDLASNTTRREALQLARETGQIFATKRIKLVQEPTNQYGFLVFLPIYYPFPQDTIVSRGDNIKGFVLGVFRISDVIEEALQGFNERINFSLHDRDNFLGFYDSIAGKAIGETDLDPSLQKEHILCSNSIFCTHSLKIGQREWFVRFYPSENYLLVFRWGMLSTLIIGFLITIILAFYLWKWQSKLQQTREISNLKMQFFSTTSHEFRTPLSTILISAQSLINNQHNFSEEQQLKIYHRIQNVTRRLTQLLNDILTLARAESGHLEFTPEILILDQLCWQIVDELEPDRLEQRRIQIENHYPDRQVYLNRKLLRAILTNLLGNALKYSPLESAVHLEIRGSDRELKFKIWDRGIGIPKESREKIYEPFYRANNVGNIIGTGLGLSVVKTCVELQGGSIAIASRTEGGTIFTVKLPLAE
ncbi:MAG: CHASE domain-containing protein [Cyanobacteria bacterium SBLK]|nr:CHASE domain-containing protein [Cyanobacteria bacterium SBLK]